MPWLCACILQLVSVSVPLLSPSAALWCPNGAGITTGDHKQQLCPVRPHRAAYQHTDLIKTHSQVTECSRGKRHEVMKATGVCFIYMQTRSDPQRRRRLSVQTEISLQTWSGLKIKYQCPQRMNPDHPPAG